MSTLHKTMMEIGSQVQWHWFRQKTLEQWTLQYFKAESVNAAYTAPLFKAAEARVEIYEKQSRLEKLFARIFSSVTKEREYVCYVKLKRVAEGKAPIDAKLSTIGSALSWWKKVRSWMEGASSQSPEPSNRSRSSSVESGRENGETGLVVVSSPATGPRISVESTIPFPSPAVSVSVAEPEEASLAGLKKWKEQIEALRNALDEIDITDKVVLKRLIDKTLKQCHSDRIENFHTLEARSDEEKVDTFAKIATGELIILRKEVGAEDSETVQEKLREILDRWLKLLNTLIPKKKRKEFKPIDLVALKAAFDKEIEDFRATLQREWEEIEQRRLAREREAEQRALVREAGILRNAETAAEQRYAEMQTEVGVLQKTVSELSELMKQNNSALAGLANTP